MWSYNLGYNAGTPSWNQSYNYGGPSYDQSANYAAQQGPGTGTGGSSLGGLWSGLIGAAGSYASAQAQNGAREQQSQMSAQAQLDELKQQREYQTQDKQYKKDAVSKWNKYFS